MINADLAELLALAHLYDESIRWSRKTIEMDPDFGLAHNHLGEAYLQKHMINEAVAELTEAVRLSNGSPTCIANLARAYAASGRKNDAETLLSDLKKRSSPGQSLAAEIAAVYVSLGDADHAMSWLERGTRSGSTPASSSDQASILSGRTLALKTSCAVSASVADRVGRREEEGGLWWCS